MDENGQYVPKRPRYKLKDKEGFVHPPGLDTNNIYYLSEVYHMGVLQENYSNGSKYYDKFYSNGRMLSFGIEGSDSLEISDLDPNNKFYSKNYYYSNGGSFLQVETFFKNQGVGEYYKYNIEISDGGEKLIRHTPKRRTIYVLKKENIPQSWNGVYDVDW